MLPEIARERAAAYERCSTKIEVDRLMEQFRLEDETADAAEDWRTREVAGLKQALAAVQRDLADLKKRHAGDIRSINRNFVMLVGDGEKKGGLDHVLDRIEALEKRPVGLQYRGLWAPEIGYAGGSLVTKDGTAWVAMEPTSPGEKPGAGGPWKMILKGDEALVRRTVKDELRKQPGVA